MRDASNQVDFRGPACKAIFFTHVSKLHGLLLTRNLVPENTGFLSKHPTTQKPIPSPFINIGINYMNQAVRLWNEIFQIVKENCSTDYGEVSPQDDLMERLLRDRQG